MSTLNIGNFIWGIADDVLRDVYVRGKYRDVILPMTVIRRLDAVLEPTKEAVLRMKEQLDAAGITNQDSALCQASGQAFYNASPFRLRDLASRARQQRLRADFEAYLDGFSPNVQEVLEKFRFRNQIPTLVEADALGFLLEKFLDGSVNLGPEPVRNEDGSVRLEGLDNHGMGPVFEELIRRFSEENNEEAGEHFTPRDVVQLMAHLVFLPVADAVKSGTYLVYDGACGTGGMLTVAEDTLTELAGKRGKEVSVHLYGQEVNPETYAISKADLILKGEGVEADNMRYGSTLSGDGFPAREFDFMLSNPPYGKSWKSDLERMGGKSGVKDLRFVVEHRGDPDYSLITRSSDGQMMFRGFHSHQGHKEGVFHQALGFRAGNQYIRVHQQIDAVELFVLQDVGQRLPLQPPRHNLGQSLLLRPGNFHFLLGEQVLPLHPQRIHQHHLGLQAGVRDVARLESAVGLLNYFAQDCHSGRAGPVRPSPLPAVWPVPRQSGIRGFRPSPRRPLPGGRRGNWRRCGGR